MTVFLSLISLLANTWVTLVYLKNPELQNHPSPILAFISLFEVSMSHHAIALALETNFSIKGHGPHYLIEFLSFFHLTRSESKSISCAINQMLYAGAAAGVLCYNTFLCVDIMITLRNPLIPGKKRMKFYHCIGGLMIVFQMGFNLYWNLDYDECFMDSRTFLYETWNKGMLLSVYVVYAPIAFGSVCYSGFKLCTKGSFLNQATKEYLIRHLVYIFVLSFMWTWSACNFLFDRYGEFVSEFRKDKAWVLTISTVVITSSGFIQAIMRNWEKAFWKKSKEMLKKRELSKVSSCLSSDVFSTVIFSKDFRKVEDCWNVPTSFIMQESMKSNSTLCILMGLHEGLRLVSTEEELALFKIDLRSQNFRLSMTNFFSFPYFLVEVHKPEVFEQLKKNAGFELSEALHSIHPENNKLSLLSLHQEQGGSGSLFIFTEDKKFVIKIITLAEKDFFLQKLLKKYSKHLESNPRSLLNRIFGIFTIKIPGLSPLEVMISQSLIQDNVEKFYDLKGSTFNRLASKPDTSCFKGPFKDSDFLNDDVKFVLHPFIAREAKQQVRNDSKFLMQAGVMDYSLIVAVYKSEDSGLFPSPDLKLWFKLGIIDFLGEFSFKRKAEYYVKLIRHGKKIRMCSVMNPVSYYERFINFVNTKVLLSE
jgi:hypothetical protein